MDPYLFDTRRNTNNFRTQRPKRATHIDFMADLMASPSPTVEPTAHPLAGKRMSGSEIIVRVLADEGVDNRSHER